MLVDICCSELSDRELQRTLKVTTPGEADLSRLAVKGSAVFFLTPGG
jgi:hypothetical protein